MYRLSSGGKIREVTGSNPVEVLNFFQASLRNCINCVHCDDHFFIFISLPQFIYDLFHISLETSLLHVFLVEILYVLSFPFFFTAAHFHLGGRLVHWWPLAFLILSPLLQSFHVVLPTKKMSPLFFFSLSFAGLPPTFPFSLSFSCSIFKICGHDS